MRVHLVRNYLLARDPLELPRGPLNKIQETLCNDLSTCQSAVTPIIETAECQIALNLAHGYVCISPLNRVSNSLESCSRLCLHLSPQQTPRAVCTVYIPVVTGDRLHITDITD